jgi:hypothetical protein
MTWFYDISAPGPATNLQVVETLNSGFSMHWCDPVPDPQCADDWNRDVQELKDEKDIRKFPTCLSVSTFKRLR